MFKKVVKAIEHYRNRRAQKLDQLAALKKPTLICETARFTFQRNISIGRYCRVGSRCHIDGEGGVSIGDGTILASNVTILSSSHNYDQGQLLPYDETDKTEVIIIGRGVWIGWGAIILPGVTVGDGSVVAAGSVVTKNVPSGHVVGGNPAKIIAVRSASNDDIQLMLNREQFYLKALWERKLKRVGRT